YVLQAKALAHGHFAWHEPWPSASFRGRFLVFEHEHLAGIFPPGWPLMLSMGFILGSPMLVRIALAAALAIATYYLARAANPEHAATGSFFESTQRAYYATSDGPPGCFRMGFGDGIGCVHEHGDFVHARLEHGFGLVAALGTTLRRLHTHLSDALVAWPLFFL